MYHPKDICYVFVQSPDGKMIAVGGIDGTVHIFDIETAKGVQKLDGTYISFVCIHILWHKDIIKCLTMIIITYCCI